MAMELDQAFEHALDGDALLFVGAGFSLGARNVRAQPLKTGNGFAQHLAALAGVKNYSGLEDVAEAFLEKLNADTLIHELHQEFTVSAVAPHHTLLAAVPWRRIYTTNYDNVFERSRADQKLGLYSVTLSDDPKDVGKKDTLCVHLNGYVGRLNRSTLQSELKLTDTSYVTAAISDSPWAVSLRQDIVAARAVFFVGYSGADLDIRRLLAKTQSLHEKTFFVVGQNPDDSTLRRAARFGDVLQLSAGDFAAQLEKKRASYTPREKTRIFESFREISSEPTPATPADKNFFDFMLLGTVEPAFIRSSIRGGKQFCIYRSQVDDVLKSFAAQQIAVVHSGLGNGKSIFLDILVYRAQEAGYRTFVAVDKTDAVLAEVADILTGSTPTLLVFDKYQTWIDVVEFASMNARATDRLVLAARSAIHDVVFEDMLRRTGQEDVFEVGIDKLTDAECAELASLMDLYGVWGTRAALKPAEKVDFLKRDCKGQLSGVLLKLLEAPQMLARLNQLFDGVRTDHRQRDVILATLILTVIGYSVTIQMLMDVSEGELINHSTFRTNPAIKELLHLDSGEARVRSAVIARFILRRIAPVDAVVTTLVRLARRADQASRGKTLYQDVFGSLMRFNTIQQVLPDKQRKDAVFRYYEAVKNLPGAKENALFWLQYGIATLFHKDFDRADKYFETSYAFAGRRTGFDTFQIDNHYARFLLMRAAEGPERDDYMESFRAAKTIVNRQIESERKHYPYRVASLYLDFWSKYEGKLATAEIREVLEAAQFVIKRATALPPWRRSNQDVVECMKALNSLTDRGKRRMVSAAGSPKPSA